MPDRRLSNARIMKWLADDLNQIAEQMASPKVQVNSAALWWFCRLSPEERARILGEFVTATAMRNHTDPPAATDPPPRRRKPKGR